MSRRWSLMVLVVAATAVPGAAQQADFMDPAVEALVYARAAKANAGQLLQYSWKQRTKIEMDGKIHLVKLDSVRFDAAKHKQVTSISVETPQVPKAGPVRKKIEGEKVTKLDEMAKKLTRLVSQYTMMTPGRTVDLFVNSNISGQTAAASGDDLEISARNVVLPMDSVSLKMNRKTLLPYRLTFSTMADDTELRGDVEYRPLDDGPYYTARTVLALPARKVKITIENFGYIKQ